MGRLESDWKISAGIATRNTKPPSARISVGPKKPARVVAKPTAMMRKMGEVIERTCGIRRAPISVVAARALRRRVAAPPEHEAPREERTPAGSSRRELRLEKSQGFRLADVLGDEALADPARQDEGEPAGL